MEVAELLGLSRSKVFEMLATEELPVVRFGRVVRTVCIVTSGPSADNARSAPAWVRSVLQSRSRGPPGATDIAKPVRAGDR